MGSKSPADSLSLWLHGVGYWVKLALVIVLADLVCNIY